MYDEDFVDKVINSDFASVIAMMSPAIKIPLLMDVTNVCDYNCPICYKTSGFSRFNMRDFVDVVESAGKNSRCNGELVGITGGEPCALYTHFKTSDLRDMMQVSFDNGFNVVLKTNAGWTRNEKMADLIWGDIDNLDRQDRKFGIDLSLSVYHKNAVATTNRVLSHVCCSEKIGADTQIELLCTGSDSRNLDKVLSKQNLDALGLKIESTYYPSKSTRSNCVIYTINQTRVVVSSDGEIARVGNAKKNGLGRVSHTNNLSIVKYPGQIVLWFDFNGMVHIAHKHKPHWSVKYKHENGKVKSIDEILDEFSDILFKEVLRRAVKRNPDFADIAKNINRDYLVDFIPYYENFIKQNLNVRE